MTEARLLIVEDEGIIARDLEQRLRFLNYHVVGIVENGEQAIKVAGETKPDLVLMDIQLKGVMDGIHTSSKLMELYRLPTIYLTAFSDENTLRRAKLTEPYGYVLKPFEDRELLTHVEIALYRKKSEEEKMNIKIELEHKMKELELMNSQLDMKIQEEVKKNQEKDRLLILKSRQALLSGMVGDIAHRWKQPLNALGIMVQNIELAYHREKLDDVFIKDTVERSRTLIRDLSRTIDDFRKFFKPDREKETQNLAPLIEKAVALVEPDFTSRNLELKLALDQETTGLVYAGEYSQAVLAILLSIQEYLIEYKSDNILIEISLTGRNGQSDLVLKDNSGRMTAKELDKMSNPDFSNNLVSGNTGLAIAKMIIESGMNGTVTLTGSNGAAEFHIFLK